MESCSLLLNLFQVISLDNAVHWCSFIQNVFISNDITVQIKVHVNSMKSQCICMTNWFNFISFLYLYKKSKQGIKSTNENVDDFIDDWFKTGRNINCKFSVVLVFGFVCMVWCGWMIYDLLSPLCLYLSASDMLCYHL